MRDPCIIVTVHENLVDLLSSKAQMFVPLKEEIEMLKHKLKLLQIRLSLLKRDALAMRKKSRILGSKFNIGLTSRMSFISLLGWQK